MSSNSSNHRKEVRRGVRLFLAPGALERVQNLVALVHARTRSVLAREHRRVLEVSDNASIDEPQLGREIQFDRHTASNDG
jgi:hypothetical protein